MDYNFDNNKPIYIQLVEELKMEIISEKLPPGTRLLSVRELALKYKVNPNTMQKALAQLEQLNLIYTERTNGKYVTADQQLIQTYQKEYATNLAKNYFQSMELIGFSKEEAMEYLQEFGGKEQ